MFETQYSWSFRRNWNTLEFACWQREWWVGGSFFLLMGIGSIMLFAWAAFEAGGQGSKGLEFGEMILGVTGSGFILMGLILSLGQVVVVFDATHRTVKTCNRFLRDWSVAEQSLGSDACLEIHDLYGNSGVPARFSYNLVLRNGQKETRLLTTLLYKDVYLVGKEIADFAGLTIKDRSGDPRVIYDPYREAVSPLSLVGIVPTRDGPDADEFPVIPENCRIQLALEDSDVVMTLPPVGWGPSQKNALLMLIMVFPMLPLLIVPAFLPTKVSQEEELPSVLWLTLTPVTAYVAYVLVHAVITSRVKETLRFSPDLLTIERKWPGWTSRQRITRDQWDVIHLIPQARWVLGKYNAPLRFAVWINREKNPITLSGMLFQDEAVWLREMIARM